MSTKLLFVSVVGAAAVAAGAAGGYTALRSNAADLATAPPTLSTPAVETSGAVVEPATSSDKPAPAERNPDPTALQAVGPRSELPHARPVPVSTPAPTRNWTRPETPAAVSPAPVAVAPPDQVQAPRPVTSDVKDPRPEPVPVAPVEPAKPLFEELTVKEDSVIGIRLDSAISTETARVEDRVAAHVARDVTVAGHTAIPSGARLEGTVSVVERGGKFRDRARVGIQFHSLILADGTRTRIQTETIFREGESPTGPAASKVGASAVVGSILGAVIGGKKGAAIGATTGAAAGGAAVAATTKNELVIPAGTLLTVRMTAPVTLSVERDQDLR